MLYQSNRHLDVKRCAILWCDESKSEWEHWWNRKGRQRDAWCQKKTWLERDFACWMSVRGWMWICALVWKLKARGVFILSGNRSLSKRQTQVDRTGVGFLLGFAGLAQMSRWWSSFKTSRTTHLIALIAMAIFRSCANMFGKKCISFGFAKVGR